MPNFAKHARQTLSFWRDIEFFIPFDLDDVRDTYFDRCFAVRQDNSASLPWLNPEKFNLKADREYAFDFYFAPFLKSEIVRLLTFKFPDISREIFTDPRELTGLSCYARISFNSNGQILLDEAKISTLPWALDSLLAEQPLNLSSFDYFASAYLNSIEHELEKLYKIKENEPSVNIVNPIKNENWIYYMPL